MPLSETLSGFFADEYQRFMRGLDKLQQPDRVYYGAAARRQAENAARPRLVQIPAWDDVLHISPRLAVTPEQTAEYRRSARAGFTPSLPPEVSQELARREARYDAMQRSPQPEFDRAWGSVMTAIDNVQDFTGAISVLGRVALSIGARVGLRAIPGLGQLLLASDILNAAMFAGQVAFPLWLLMCSGPRAFGRALAGTLLTHVAFKGTTGLIARASGKSLAWQFKGPVEQVIHTGGGWAAVKILTAPSWTSARAISGLIGAGLVIGQTTDQLFGYGISLGPIVGGTMGAAYGLEARSRGVEVEIRSTPSAEHFWPRVRPRLADVPTSALLDRITAAAVWEQLGLILHPQSGATNDERLLAMTAILPAVGTLAADWKKTGWQQDVYRLDSWRPAPPPRAVGRPDWIELIGARANLQALQWPKAWGGSHYAQPEALMSVADDVRRGLEHLSDGAADPTVRAYIGAVTLEAAEALWLLILEDPHAIRAKLTPPYLALERMGAVGFLPNPQNDTKAFQPFWDQVIQRVANSRHGMQTLTEWTELADRLNIDYLITGHADIGETPPT